MLGQQFGNHHVESSIPDGSIFYTLIFWIFVCRQNSPKAIYYENFKVHGRFVIDLNFAQLLQSEHKDVKSNVDEMGYKS